MREPSPFRFQIEPLEPRLLLSGADWMAVAPDTSASTGAASVFEALAIGTSAEQISRHDGSASFDLLADCDVEELPDAGQAPSPEEPAMAAATPAVANKPAAPAPLVPSADGDKPDAAKSNAAEGLLVESEPYLPLAAAIDSTGVPGSNLASAARGLHALPATQVSWTGAAKSTLWSDPLNWDSKKLPTATSAVIIKGAAVTIPKGFTATVLSVNATGSLKLDGSVLEIAQASSVETLLMDGTAAALTGRGDLTVIRGTITAGTLDGEGRFIIAKGGEVTFNAATFTIRGSRVLQNQGTTTFANSTILFRDTASIDNLSTLRANGKVIIGLNAAQTGSVLQNRPGALLEVNSSGAKSILSSNVRLINEGRLDVRGGELEVSGGGLDALTADKFNRFTGSTQVAAGAVLRISGGGHEIVSGVGGAGTLAVSSGLVFGGSVQVGTVIADGPGGRIDATTGTITLLSINGGSVRFSGLASISNLSMSSGTIGGSGTLSLGGGFVRSGAFQGTGKTIIASGARISFEGSGVKELRDSHTIENRGLLVVSGSGALQFPAGSTARIDNFGILDVQNDLAIGSPLALSGAIVNRAGGRLLKSGGSGPLLIEANVELTNDGSIAVTSGELQVR
ncbi:MAG: LEPR-XLL domain-containing protein [Pedosphaera sp.]|nr:LEPR-XLL domain-containing protein [Pedosphaera sp.]